MYYVYKQDLWICTSLILKQIQKLVLGTDFAQSDANDVRIPRVFVLEKTLCTTPSVSKKVGMDSENYSLVIQSIGSHSVKSTVLKVDTLNDGYMINVHACRIS